MRLVRGLAGALLWIAAALLGLVGVLLCVTIILLPVGVPLLRLAGKSFASATRLMLPPGLAHPVKETQKGLRKRGEKAGEKAEKAGEKAEKAGEKAKDAVPDTSPSDLLSEGRKKVTKKSKARRLFG